MNPEVSQHGPSSFLGALADRAVALTPRSVGGAAAIGLVLFLAVYRLTDFPLTWFDEGSHLHVPKTLVTYGVYADRSSEGFRHYGPTIGVGPTVMLPIAGVFTLFGIGLLQARAVMVAYLLGAILAFHRLAGGVSGRRVAWIATALLVSSRAVAILELGRQVMGEVPGLLFAASGLAVWFSAWEDAAPLRLGLAGLLLGLAMVTKSQLLLVLAPTLALTWLANSVYYRTLPHRTFAIPATLALACVALWQGYLVLYLGPSTSLENLTMFRQAASSAAVVMSPALMVRSIRDLLGPSVYLGWLVPALMYGVVLAAPRHREAQKWAVLLTFVGVNLVWYAVGSVGWLRYAFAGLAVSSLFIARFCDDVAGAEVPASTLSWLSAARSVGFRRSALRLVMYAWLASAIVFPLGQTALDVLRPAFNSPAAMAEYLNTQVPTSSRIETWEPEMGFLTDHEYHYPPPALLSRAVGHIWLGQAAPSEEYTVLQVEQPEYVLVGEFARWVRVYPQALLDEHYAPVMHVGAYELYRRANLP